MTLVSVIIPARNAERYLAEAIQSALGQDHQPLEIVVIDDASTDGTRRVAEALGARCATVEHGGAGAARNAGVELSNGEVLAFLDADDVWRPGKLALQLERLASADLVFGLLDEFVSPDAAPGKRARPGVYPGHVASALAVARTTFDRVGPFATQLTVGEFVDWIARAKALGLSEDTPPQRVVSRRVHDANSTTRNHDSLGDLARVLKRSLDHRRVGETP